eukprot:gene3764-6652_t
MEEERTKTREAADIEHEVVEIVDTLSKNIPEFLGQHTDYSIEENFQHFQETIVFLSEAIKLIIDRCEDGAGLKRFIEMMQLEKVVDASRSNERVKHIVRHFFHDLKHHIHKKVTEEKEKEGADITTSDDATINEMFDDFLHLNV